MRQVGEALVGANVGAIVLIHGTFVGDDPLGINAMFSGPSVDLYRWFTGVTKRRIDWFTGDIGNFPMPYVRELAHGIRGEPGRPRPIVRRFVWSSMNNHVARAVAAVQLVGYLAKLNLAPRQRILIWAHSHGGNALALLTNLLTADRDRVAQFLDAAGGYARPLDESWDESCRLVMQATSPLHDHPLDLVTLGMPIRYGFDTNGFARLLHFVNHRPSRRRPDYLATPPHSFGDLVSARRGDYVQQYGIAGSNFSTPFHWRMWKADRQLAQMLSPNLSCWGLLSRIRQRMRVPQDGRTLLVDYPHGRGRWVRSLLGHGQYTHRDWMLLHAEQVVHNFYRDRL